METYISTDIESNGPIPGEYSMLSFGSVALNIKKEILGTFTRNLTLIPNASCDPDTMAWWNQSRNITAYNQTRLNTVTPELAMKEYIEWVSGFNNPVFVAYPAGFDFTFIYWYMMKFAKRSPFSFSAIDIKTFAMGMLDKDYRASTKKNMPKRWFDKNLKHTHNALDDAMEQGMLFINMLNENKQNIHFMEKHMGDYNE